MNHITLKQMTYVDMRISDSVPVVGEIFVDTTCGILKVGDGETAIKDLPCVVDLVKERSSLSRTAKLFIENNIELIKTNDYDTLYSRIASLALAQEITRALLKADLNPKPYLSKIPDSIKHLLEPDKVWAEDTSRLYVDNAQPVMSVIDEFNKKLFMQTGIPQSIIKVGN